MMFNESKTWNLDDSSQGDNSPRAHRIGLAGLRCAVGLEVVRLNENGKEDTGSESHSLVFWN